MKTPEAVSAVTHLPQRHTTPERIASLGIVGAGGGGFPTAAKLATRVSTVIANAAECEPLLHKDKELLDHHASPFLGGMQAVMEIVGAEQGIIGVKEKYHDIIAALTQQAPAKIRIAPLPDVYPAGDEFVLVHLITGRVIPPGGLPKDVDCLVANVETLINIALDQPITHKFLTVAGAVRTPMTVRVPLGITIGKVIEAAGGSTVPNPRALLGGVMMARAAASLDVPVTKTTGGIIVVPATHRLIQRHTAPWQQIARIGRSACDQCRMCTEFCPRYLLGHPIQPHRAMQSLGFTSPLDQMAAASLYCCECNLCTMYACPEDLDPRNVCIQTKPVARERNLVFTGSPDTIKPHPMADFRRVPMKRLITRLGLADFNNTGPLTEIDFAPARVTLPLKQHAGAPAEPVVTNGQRVHPGDLLAAPPAGKLGAPIHASIASTVEITADSVILHAN